MKNKKKLKTNTHIKTDANNVLIDKLCNKCEKNISMEGSDTCQWCALSDM